MAQVEFENVTKVFDDASGTIVAVEELDLDIEDGEFVVFVGPSGCGKSTTLRMLAGLERITDGVIKIDDAVINDKPPKDRDIALVFQNYALYPHKTVRGNMAYGLNLSTDLSETEIEKRVEDTATMMGIEELLDKKPGSLSGGQQQRVATGRAIVREPSVFLFDEPLSNLDAKLRKHMRTELARLHSELNITTIYVTHDQEEAMTLADRIVILNDGGLQQIGYPKDVYNRPANLFVADFIGSPSMNFFDVELRTNDDGSGTLVGGDDFAYDVSEALAGTIADESDSAEYVVGIRPENIRIDNSVPAGKAIEARVDVVEIVGSDNFIYLNIDGRECRVRTSSEIEPEPEEVVTITFDEEHVHVFDGRTEQAITHGHTEASADTPVAEP